MTTKEAIYLLRNTAWLAPSSAPIDEAIDMACEALRKDEPQTDIHDLTDCDFCKDRNCKDCEGGKDEPQTCDDCIWNVCNYNKAFEDEPQTCSVSGRPYTDCSRCEHFKCTADEPQTETCTGCKFKSGPFCTVDGDCKYFNRYEPQIEDEQSGKE